MEGGVVPQVSTVQCTVHHTVQHTVQCTLYSPKNNLRQNIVGLEQKIYASQENFYTIAGCDG